LRLVRYIVSGRRVVSRCGAHVDCAGHVEWVDAERMRGVFFWRSADEWGERLIAWASLHGFLGAVCTLADIQTLRTDGDANGACKSVVLGPRFLMRAARVDFFNLDRDVILRAVHALENKGKAALLETGDGSFGVKFFH
jgi:hypothetical protein